jgi:hypothetical protein
MGDRDIIRGWLEANLAAKGRGARRELADFLGLRSQAISRMLSMTPGAETREISAAELLRMAEFFGVSPPGQAGGQITGFAEEAAPYAADDAHRVAIMGYVGAGGEVQPAFKHVPPDGLDQVELPFALPHDVIGLQVRSDAMLPRYDDGTVIVVYREQQRSTASLIGEEAAVRIHDGHRYLKRIMPGPRPQTYNLESANARTIVGARIVWASEIVMIVPASRIRPLVAGRVRRRGAKTR